MAIMKWKKRVPWESLGELGCKWRLASFDQRQPPTWEKYWADQREYWCVDKPDGRNTRPWFWKTFTEESFLADAKMGYAKLVDYYKHWNGLCTIGDSVEVVRVAPDTIVLSKKWSGAIADHSDLEIELYRDFSWLVLPVGFSCSIHSFGTVTVLPGSAEAMMGERVGSSRVAHDRSTRASNQDLGVSFNPSERIVRLWDARFEVLN
jgi:hypothetical protein